LAGYRLLDPRSRRQLYDRVQLSYIIYRELDELPCHIESNERLPLITEKPIVSFPTQGGLMKTELMSLDIGLDPATVYPIPPEAHPDGLGKTAFSSLDDAREIVRLLNGSELQARTHATGVSRWIRAARKVSSFYRMVRCALL